MTQLFFIDLFCGAGGVTSGIHRARINGKPIAEVIACVNHDPLAIESHSLNHPGVLHYTEDIRVLDISDLVKLVVNLRKQNPGAKICVWASLECTNFSRAKGGLPRNADSRTLAEHLYRYIEQLNPDYIYIENVVEFMSWGPLDDNGKPISNDKGKDYMKWVKKVKTYGYNFEHQVMNAANFGAYTSRKRFFGQFAKIGLPIAWPQATHAKKVEYNIFGSLKKWKAVKDVLDLKDTGESIFTRKKNLSDKTYERIYHGLVKFVAGGKKEFQNFFVKYTSASTDGSLNNTNSDISNPSPTIGTQRNPLLATVEFLTTYHGNGENLHSTDGVSPTVPTKDSISLITPFLMRDFTREPNSNSIDNPAGSITGTPKLNLVTPFIMNNYTNGGTDSSIDNPLGAVTPVVKANLVSPQYFLMNPQFMVKGRSIEDPCFTLIARMDKAPPYLVEVEGGRIGIEIFENDSKFMVLIKEFMAIYGIVDIKMRMLRIPELLRIQGFGDQYKLVGTQDRQKKFIGNAVEVTQAQKIIEASCQALMAA